jgi:hypothetical protein
MARRELQLRVLWRVGKSITAMKGKRISINAQILARRLGEVYSQTLKSFNFGFALQDWRQAYRNRGNRNAIFMWVPKTAGNSIFSILDRYGTQNLRD